jgi:hypothetical protein
MDKTNFIMMYILVPLILAGGVAGVLEVIYEHHIQASTLEKESLPLNTTGSPIPLNSTDDAEDIDISIDPTEDITSPNGTQSISTRGATDIDINDFPPEGVTVVIENQTVSVTENPVTIEDPMAAQVQEQAPAAVQNEIDSTDE